MIKAHGQYGGGRDNPDGESWIKFDFPLTERQNIAPYLFLDDVLLHMVVDIDSERMYAGCAISNNMVKSPKGNVIITLRGKKTDIKEEVVKLMPGKTFDIRLLTEKEMNELLQDVDDNTSTAQDDALDRDIKNNTDIEL